MVLGVHDLTFLNPQSISIDKVFNSPRGGGFPPTTDISLIHLSKPAIMGTEHFLPTDQSLSCPSLFTGIDPILVSLKHIPTVFSGLT